MIDEAAARHACPDLVAGGLTDLRSPELWLDSIASPVFVIEGTEEGSGNIESLLYLQGVNKNPLVHFCPVPGGNHWTVIAPVTELIASQILADTGPEPTFQFSEALLREMMRRETDPLPIPYRNDWWGN